MENYDSCLSGPWSLPQGKVLPNLNKALIVDVCPVWSRISLGILHYRGTLGTNIKMEWDRFLHIEHWFIYLSTLPHIQPSPFQLSLTHLSTYLPIDHPSIHSSIYSPIQLFTHLPFAHLLTIHPSIYLSTHPSSFWACDWRSIVAQWGAGHT